MGKNLRWDYYNLKTDPLKTNKRNNEIRESNETIYIKKESV